MTEALSIAAPTPPSPRAPNFSARDRRVCLLVLAIGIMNVFDLLLTIQAQRQGVLVETNPIAQSLLPHGLGALVVFKILLVGFGSCVLLWYRRRLLAECMAWMVVAINVVVSFHWMFCYRFYELTLRHGSTPELGIPALGMLNRASLLPSPDMLLMAPLLA